MERTLVGVLWDLACGRVPGNDRGHGKTTRVNFRTGRVVAWGDEKRQDDEKEEDDDEGENDASDERVTLEDVVTRLSMPSPGTALSPNSLARRGGNASTAAFQQGRTATAHGVGSIASAWGFANSPGAAVSPVATYNRTTAGALGMGMGGVAGMNLDWEERLLQDISRWIVRARKSPASAFRELLHRGRNGTAAGGHHSLSARRSAAGRSAVNRHLGMDAEELQAALRSLGREESEEQALSAVGGSGGGYWSMHPISLLEAERLLHLLDADGDRRVGRSDFEAAFGGGNAGGLGESGSSMGTTTSAQMGAGGGRGQGARGMGAITDPFRQLRDLLYDKGLTVADLVTELDRDKDVSCCVCACFPHFVILRFC